MRDVSILLARAVAFFDTADIDPRGKLFHPDLVRELVTHYNFQKAPATLEEWRDEKGAAFEVGRLGNRVITKLLIWNTGVTVETLSNTSDSKEIMEDMFEWTTKKFGLAYKPEIIKHWAYISDLSFYSDVELLSSPPVSRLAEKTSKAVSEILGEPLTYEPMIITVGHDPLARKWGRAPFSIQRRAESPFRDHKYFSEAPLPTDVHIRLMTEFESDVASQKS